MGDTSVVCACSHPQSLHEGLQRDCMSARCACSKFAGARAPVDNIHPAHYKSHPSGIECITVVRHMTFNIGNAIKYLWRADLKGAPIEDLKKARWYIDDEIAKREKETAK